MRIFITGATGFIGGRTVAAAIERGWTVSALVRSPDRATHLSDRGVTLVPGDITDPASFADAMRGIDAVFHLAAWYALGVRDRAAMERTNVLGTENVLGAAMAAGVPRVVYCSSVAALGVQPMGSVADETLTHGRVFGSIYEETKWKAHERAHELARDGLSLVTVLPGAVYGPGDTSLLGVLLKMYARRRLVLLPFQDASASWVHVDDVAAGIVRAVTDATPGEDYILGGDNETIGGLLRRVAPLTGIRPPRASVPRGLMRATLPLGGLIARALGQAPGAMRDGFQTLSGSWMFSSEKARQAFGYSFRSIEDGIPETVRALGARA